MCIKKYTLCAGKYTSPFSELNSRLDFFFCKLKMVLYLLSQATAKFQYCLVDMQEG